MWALEATPLDRSAAELNNDTHEHLAWAKSYRARILEGEGPQTIENTLVPYNEMMMHLDAAANDCSLFAHVHPDPRVCAVAEEGKQVIAEYMTELRLDRGLHDALRTLDMSRTDAETRSFVTSILRDDPADMGTERPLTDAGRPRMDTFRRRLAQVLLAPEAAQPAPARRDHTGVAQASDSRARDVLRELLNLTSQLFDIRYERVHGLNLWHQAVTAWDVYDGNTRLGRIYLHLDSPVGDSGSVRHFVYRRGVDGVRLPQSVLVGNLDLEKSIHDSIEVTALAQQFGQLLDNILSGDRRWISLDGFERSAAVPSHRH
jgi:Zn-dependent oligopeptidase